MTRPPRRCVRGSVIAADGSCCPDGPHPPTPAEPDPGPGWDLDLGPVRPRPQPAPAPPPPRDDDERYGPEDPRAEPWWMR